VSDDGKREAAGPDVDAADVKRHHQARLLAMPGVCGVAVASDSAGNPVLQVHVSRDQPRPRLPTDIEGLAVEVRESGPFQPLALVPPSR
jgi:hypothetical protein